MVKGQSSWLLRHRWCTMWCHSPALLHLAGVFIFPRHGFEVIAFDCCWKAALLFYAHLGLSLSVWSGNPTTGPCEHWTAVLPAFHCFTCALNERQTSSVSTLASYLQWKKELLQNMAILSWKKKCNDEFVHTIFSRAVLQKDSRGLALESWSRETHTHRLSCKTVTIP